MVLPAEPVRQSNINILGDSDTTPHYITPQHTTAQYSTPYHSEMKQQQNIILSLQDFNIEILKNLILRPYQG